MAGPYTQTFVDISNAPAAIAANLAAAQVDFGAASIVVGADTTIALGPDGVTYTLVSSYTLAPIPGS